MANFNVNSPPSRTDLLERDRDGRFTGKMHPIWVRWLGDFVTAMAAFAAMVDVNAVASQFDQSGADQDARDTAEIALLRDSGSRVVVEGEPAGLFHVERLQEGPGLADMLALFSGDRSNMPVARIIANTAADIGLYPAAAHPEAVYLETDTNLWRYSAAGAWVQFGTFDDAYGVGFNGSTKGVTQNAFYDKMQTLLGSSAYTPTNVTTDRAYDANATTLDEIADVLGSLIADLQGKGILS